MKDKLQKFNQRWSVTASEPYEESFNKFKTRILNIFEDIDLRVTETSVHLFCQTFGIKENLTYDRYDHGRGTNIISYLRAVNDEIQFYKILEVIFTLNFPGLANSMMQTLYTKQSYYNEVSQAIDLSDVNLSVAKTNEGEVIFYPKGEGILDEVLVEQVLSFLNKESNDHFIEALQYYQAKKHVDSAECIRRSLEEFLRHKLNNTAVLKSNINNLGTLLKDQEHDNWIRDIVIQFCDRLDKYFNENSKHGDGDIDDTENEFLIYQAGVLMRYLNKSL